MRDAGRRGGARPERAAVVRAGVAALGLLLVTSCIGVTSREDFDAEIRARGGGFDRADVEDAVDRVAEDLGPDFDVLDVQISPGSGTVTIRARRPGTRDVDSYSFAEGRLRSVSPVRVRADDDVEGTATPVSAFELSVLAGLVTEARERAGVAEGYVAGIRLSRDPDPEGTDGRVPLVTIEVEGPRSSARVRFAPDGRFVDLEAT